MEQTLFSDRMSRSRLKFVKDPRRVVEAKCENVFSVAPYICICLAYPLHACNEWFVHTKRLTLTPRCRFCICERSVIVQSINPASITNRGDESLAVCQRNAPTSALTVGG